MNKQLTTALLAVAYVSGCGAITAPAPCPFTEAARVNYNLTGAEFNSAALPFVEYVATAGEPYVIAITAEHSDYAELIETVNGGESARVWQGTSQTPDALTTELERTLFEADDSAFYMLLVSQFCGAQRSMRQWGVHAQSCRCDEVVESACAIEVARDGCVMHRWCVRGCLEGEDQVGACAPGTPECRAVTPTPTPTETPTPTPSVVVSATPIATPSASVVASATPLATPTATIRPTPTETPSACPTPSVTSSPSPSASPTPSPTPTQPPTPTPSPTCDPLQRCCTEDTEDEVCEPGEQCNTPAGRCELLICPADEDPCTFEYADEHECRQFSYRDCCQNDAVCLASERCAPTQPYPTCEQVVCPDDGDTCTREVPRNHTCEEEVVAPVNGEWVFGPCQAFVDGCGAGVERAIRCEGALCGGVCEGTQVRACEVTCCVDNTQCGDEQVCASGRCEEVPCPDDGNVCTAEVVENRVCNHQNIGDCCLDDSTCQDAEYCDVMAEPYPMCEPVVCPPAHTCFRQTVQGHQCTESFISGCCVDNAQCSGAQVCESNTCVALNCNDGDLCTVDGVAASHACPEKLSTPNCCTVQDDCQQNAVCVFAQNMCEPLDCEDSNDCTDDRAAGHVCSNEQIPRCCFINDECSSAEVCTAHVCEAVPCDDGNACTREVPRNHACEQDDVPPINGNWVFGPCQAFVGGCGAGVERALRCEGASCGGVCQGGQVRGCQVTCCVDNTECGDEQVCTGGRCEDVPCADDGDVCTAEVVLNRVCTHQEIGECCRNDTACQDTEYCDVMAEPYPMCEPVVCPPAHTCFRQDVQNHQCNESFIPGCCVDNAQCSGAQVCESNVCVALDCNDGDPCTVDGSAASHACPEKLSTPNCCKVSDDCTLDAVCDLFTNRCESLNCEDGNDCTDDRAEAHACVNEQMPVNGNLSDWGACTGTCGQGTQTRSCTNPAPSCGGEACSGPDTQTCPLSACPSPTPSASPTESPTPSPTATPTPTATPSASPTATPTASPTGSPTASPSPSVSPTPPPTASVSPTPTPSESATPTPPPVCDFQTTPGGTMTIMVAVELSRSREHTPPATWQRAISLHGVIQEPIYPVDPADARASVCATDPTGDQNGWRPLRRSWEAEGNPAIDDWNVYCVHVTQDTGMVRVETSSPYAIRTRVWVFDDGGAVPPRPEYPHWELPGEPITLISSGPQWVQIGRWKQDTGCFTASVATGGP